MNIIKAIAHPNELTKDVKNDYYLLPQSKGTLQPADIVKRLEEKQIATKNVNGPAFVEQFMEECVSAVKEGYSVVTFLNHMHLSINGTITAEDLGHNIPADKVDVRMYFTQSADVRKILKEVSIHAEEQPAPSGPVIQAVYNPVTKEHDTLNTGAMVLVQGLRLAVRGDLVDEIGVFFANVESETVVRVPPAQMSPNSPTKLQFILPAAVSAGEWKISVVTQGTSNGTYTTKNSRRYDYPNTLTVI